MSDKVYRMRDGVGRYKYTVSNHDGIKTHKDGSPFFDLSIFSNKRARDAFVRELRQQGYKESL